jgi:hypothetical protein
LFHGIEVPNFGVRKYFDEIHGYLKLEFVHSYGLGILTRSHELHEQKKRVVDIIKKILR